MTDNTAPASAQPSLWALPSQRAREAFEAARWDDNVKTDAGMREAAMEAAYPSMRDEYVRLSIERDDARSERDQASASYQRVTAERDILARQLHAVTVSRLGLLEDLNWVADYSNDPGVVQRARKALETARAEDAEQLPSHDAG